MANAQLLREETVTVAVRMNSIEDVELCGTSSSSTA